MLPSLCFSQHSLQRAPFYAPTPSQENASFVSFSCGKPLISLSPEPHVLFLPTCHGTPYFLGYRDHKAVFVFSSDTPHTQGKHIDLRRIAHQLPPDEASLLGYAQSMLHWHKNTQFCAKCESKLQQKNMDYHCASCQSALFPRVNPVVIIRIENNDKILLARQPSFPKGMYSCIAGFVELGETVEQCVVREAYEEVGLNLHNIQYLGSQPWPYPAQLMLAFSAQSKCDQIRVDDQEIEDAQWFSREALAAMCSFRHKKGFFIPSSVAIARSMIDDYCSLGK